MRSLVLLALLALPTALAPQGRADEPGIFGYALGPGDAPVSAGTVAYMTFGASASTTVDSAGRFRIPVDRAGVFRVSVSVPGFAPYPFTATAPASKTLRLPAIHLQPATYFHARFVSAAGEPIVSPVLRRRSFDGSLAPIFEAQDATSVEFESDGAIRMGPLPHGVTALAIDTPAFAQTRLANVTVTGADALIDGGTIVVQPGATLHVDLLDASGRPVPNQFVLLEDVRPLSPLQLPLLRTNAEGRVTFDRLAPGLYRVRTATVERCVSQTLPVVRTVTVPAAGETDARIVVAGRATFRISSPTGPVKGLIVSVGPDNPAQATPMLVSGRGAPSLIELPLDRTRCRGTTDADGTVTLTAFPPGPADVAVHFANSMYVRQIAVPVGGREVGVSVPDGFLPVRVVNAAKNEPVARASITWTAGGGRSVAVSTIIGEALLEGVGIGPGILKVTAPGFQPAEEPLPEPPGIIHDVALVPLPETSLPVRVMTASGEPLANAIVEVAPANPLFAPQFAATDAKGDVTFPNAPPGTLRVIVNAQGYAASTVQVPQDNRTGVVLTLTPGRPRPLG